MTCVYCAVAPASTDDHIFAGKLFLEKHRGDLPKAPACEKCNGRKAALELELCTVLAFGGRHAAAEEILTSKTPKRLAKNEKLRRRLADSLETAFLRDGGITYQKTSAIWFDYEKLEDLLRFIGRGLTWYHWHTYLDSDDGVSVIIETESNSVVWKAILSLVRDSDKVSKNLGNDTVFYEGHRSKDASTLSVWHINLYGGVMLGGGSDGLDPTEVMTDWWVVTGPKNLLPGLARKRLATPVDD